MSDRYKSIQQLICTELDTSLECKLNDVLNRQGVISWKNIQQLKSTFTISNEVIVAYVLKNKLKFSMNPFIIKHR